jgi:hypothetical protein
VTFRLVRRIAVTMGNGIGVNVPVPGVDPVARVHLLGQGNADWLWIS